MCPCLFAALYEWEYQAQVAVIWAQLHNFKPACCWVDHCDAQKSQFVLVFPLRVYGPIRSTHNPSQGLAIVSLAGISHTCVVCTCSPGNCDTF